MPANSNAESLRFALALSSLATIAIIIYVVLLVNTLIKIWNTEFQDMQEKIFWFLFVLILSPIGMPLYLYKSWKQRAEENVAAEKEQARQVQDPRAQRSSGMSDEARARELARLLEMKKNGVLSTEEFNRAKQRLSA